MSDAGVGEGGATGRSAVPRRPLKDPTATLAPGAVRLLQSARRLLRQGGHDALRLDAIVREAGMNKSSVKYYFDNKDGLVETLIEWLDHEQVCALAERVERASRQNKAQEYVAGQMEMVTNPEGFLEFYDLLPHAIRSHVARPRLAALYEWYRQLAAHALWADGQAGGTYNDEDLLTIATITVAVIDGLGLQLAVDEHALDPVRTQRMLELMLGCVLNSARGSADLPSGESADSRS